MESFKECKLFQLQVQEKTTSGSWLFNNVAHIPNKGDEFILYDNETGDAIVEGIVERISWSLVDDDSNYTVTVTIGPNG